MVGCSESNQDQVSVNVFMLDHRTREYFEVLNVILVNLERLSILSLVVLRHP